MNTPDALVPESLIVNVNSPPPQDESTVVYSLYQGLLFAYIGYSMYEKIANPYYVGKTLYKTLALPLAQCTKIKRLESFARYSVDAIGIYEDLPKWAVARSLHKVADVATSYVPTGQSYMRRVAKDITMITGRVLADVAANYVNREIDAQVTASQEREQEIQKKEAQYQANKDSLKDMKAESEKIQKMTTDAQSIANTGYARGCNNDEQTALNLSKELNTYVVGKKDETSFFSTMYTALDGHRKIQHVKERINELIPTIFKENQEKINTQTQQTEASKSTAEHARAEQGWFDWVVNRYYGTPEPTVTIPTQPTNPLQGKDLYDFINELWVKHEQLAENSSCPKQTIALGIAKDLAEILHQDEAFRNACMYDLLNAMDGSGRRWYNDACGAIYTILTGEVTKDFEYQDHGLKKQWNGATKLPKKVMSALNKAEGPLQDQPVRPGLQINGNGSVAVQLGNTPVFTLYEGKKPAPTPTPVAPRPATPAAQTPNICPTDTPETGEQIPSSDPVQQKDVVGLNATFTSSTAAPKPEPVGKTPALKDEQRNTLNNLNDGATLTNIAMKNALGYSPLGTMGLTLNILGEMEKQHGPSITAWNATVEILVARYPIIEGPIAFCGLYANNISKAKIETHVAHLNKCANDLRQAGDHALAKEFDTHAVGLGLFDSALRELAHAKEWVKLTPQKVEQLQSHFTSTSSKPHSLDAAANQQLKQDVEATTHGRSIMTSIINSLR